jgi:hypothetical protein
VRNDFVKKKKFVLKIVPNIKKRDKEKPLKGSECCKKVLSKCSKCMIRALVCD